MNEIEENDYSDATLDENIADLSKAVVGRRIVKAGNETLSNRYGYDYEEFVLTLDDGTRVCLTNGGDCCAYTELNSFFVAEDFPNHVITSVAAQDDYTRWFILAEGLPVVTMDVSWSEGSGYYSYGFYITVKEIGEEVDE